MSSYCEEAQEYYESKAKVLEENSTRSIMSAKDVVNNPPHYNKSIIQPIDYIESNKLGFCEGNVVKYITRHNLKNGEEDIRKAIKYCEFILKYQYGKDK